MPSWSGQGQLWPLCQGDIWGGFWEAEALLCLLQFHPVHLCVETESLDSEGSWSTSWVRASRKAVWPSPLPLPVLVTGLICGRQLLLSATPPALPAPPAILCKDRVSGGPSQQLDRSNQSPRWLPRGPPIHFRHHYHPLSSKHPPASRQFTVTIQPPVKAM